MLLTSTHPLIVALAAIAEADGLSDRALGARLGVNRSTIGRYWGGMDPSLRRMRRMVQEFPVLQPSFRAWAEGG